MYVFVRNAQSRAYAAITLSFDEQEDIRCFVDGYEKLLEDEEKLEDFGFPPSTFWVKKVDKLQSVVRVNTSSLVAEFEQGNEYEKMIYFHCQLIIIVVIIVIFVCVTFLLL